MNNKTIIRWSLAISIAIVLNLFFNFTIKLVYDAPKFDDFCPQNQVTIQPDNQELCVAKGGSWTVGPEFKAGSYCDLNFTCQKQFESASQIYNRNVFVALVILGLVALIAGFWLSAYSAVSTGLSLGGILSFIVGTIRYWSDMNDYLRVIILAIILAVLIWLGIKKLKG